VWLNLQKVAFFNPDFEEYEKRAPRYLQEFYQKRELEYEKRIGGF